MHPMSYYIDSNNENISLVKTGHIGTYDYSIHDKVVVSSPDFKMDNVKPIAYV